jgi:hypothetical protein
MGRSQFPQPPGPAKPARRERRPHNPLGGGSSPAGPTSENGQTRRRINPSWDSRLERECPGTGRRWPRNRTSWQAPLTFDLTAPSTGNPDQRK